MLVFWFYQANILNTVKILVLLKNTRNFWLIHAALVSQKPVTGKLIFLCGQVEKKIIKGVLRMVLLNTNRYLGLL